MNGKYCECSNMDCPKDPDSGLLCGGKANLLHQPFKHIQQRAFYSPHRLPYYVTLLLVSHVVTKLQNTELSILLRFSFYDVLEHDVFIANDITV